MTRARATINDVARTAGVSKKTVSRVINQSPLVGEATVSRVRAAIRALGYAPDPQARSLASGRSCLVAFVFVAPGDADVTARQCGAIDAVDAIGAVLVVQAWHPVRDATGAQLIEALDRFRWRGVLLDSSLQAPPTLRDALGRLGVPVIEIDDRGGGAPGHAASRAVGRLLEKLQ
jgi:LacI family transcriptional regulator